MRQLLRADTLYFFQFVKEQQPPAKGQKQANTRSLASDLSDRGGGGERDRTDDLLLAKQALSQLSYTPLDKASWWVWLGSNQRPPPYQDGALTS